jgi:hypothetical protein
MENRKKLENIIDSTLPAMLSSVESEVKTTANEDFRKVMNQFKRMRPEIERLQIEKWNADKGSDERNKIDMEIHDYERNVNKQTETYRFEVDNQDRDLKFKLKFLLPKALESVYRNEKIEKELEKYHEWAKEKLAITREISHEESEAIRGKHEILEEYANLRSRKFFKKSNVPGMGYILLEKDFDGLRGEWGAQDFRGNIPADYVEKKYVEEIPGNGYILTLEAKITLKKILLDSMKSDIKDFQDFEIALS